MIANQEATLQNQSLPSLSKGQISKGLATAAAVGWGLSFCFDILFPAAEAFAGNLLLDGSSGVPSFLQLQNALILWLVFGLPVSVAVCFLIGFPTWRLAIRSGKQSLIYACAYGAAVGLVIGLLFLFLSLVTGLLTYFDERASFDYWASGRQVVKDGMPTAFGWRLEFFNLVKYAVIGCLSGASAYAVTRAKKS